MGGGSNLSHKIFSEYHKIQLHTTVAEIFAHLMSGGDDIYYNIKYVHNNIRSLGMGPTLHG